MATVVAMFLHGTIGIVGLIVLLAFFSLFSGKKNEEKKSEEGAGCGCLAMFALVGFAVYMLVALAYQY